MGKSGKEYSGCTGKIIRKNEGEEGGKGGRLLSTMSSLEQRHFFPFFSDDVLRLEYQ